MKIVFKCLAGSDFLVGLLCSSHLTEALHIVPPIHVSPHEQVPL